MRRNFRIAMFVGAICFASHVAADTGWSYVDSQGPRENFPTAPARRHLLVKDSPQDVRVDVVDTQAVKRFAQMRYGSPNSTRIAIMIVVRKDQHRLYVDANRDRKLDESDLILGPGPSWHARIRYQQTTQLPTDVVLIDRIVEIRLHRAGDAIGISTRGYLEGQFEVDGRLRVARMVDADASGRFGDPDDRLWIDLDGNGSWDGFSEQFPSRPIMQLAGKRYALVGDERGQHFSFQLLTGSGTVKLQLETDRGRAPSDYQALLVGVDRTAISLRKADGDVEIPVGRYRVATLAVTYAADDKNGAWNFEFSSDDRAPSFEISRDMTRVIRPLAGLNLLAEIQNKKSAYRPGKFIDVVPRLRSLDQLAINSCTRGEMRPWQPDSGPTAGVRLCNRDGVQLAIGHSGFA
jgi:hypothetical protein